MSQLITKLDSIPDDISVAPEGMHCVVLNYKTDKATQIKRPSAAYVVPKLSQQPEDSVDGRAINKWIDALQRAALSEYNAGDFDLHSQITDLDALFQDYITDNRGNRSGPKQSDLMDWITTTLVPFFAAKLEANLVGFTTEQKQATLFAYTKKFRLAATRGNKSGDESLSDQALQDLQQRFTLWTGNDDSTKNLPNSAERDCIIERIATHRAVIAKAMTDVTTVMC